MPGNCSRVADRHGPVGVWVGRKVTRRECGSLLAWEGVVRALIALAFLPATMNLAYSLCQP